MRFSMQARRFLCLAIIGSLLLSSLAGTAAAQGVGEPLQGHILVITDDHIIIDVGGSAIKGGDVGVIKHEGTQIGLALVLWVDIGQTRLRVMSVNPGQKVQVGDIVIFQSDEQRTQSPVTMPIIPFPSTGTAQFVPLLAPVAPPKTALSQGGNIFHGQIRDWQLYQKVSSNNAWYSASRVDTDGSVERLMGRPLALAWAGNATYRDGSTFSASDDFRHPQPHLYRFTLSDKFENSGFARLGRFFPMEVPVLGYVDGAQIEEPLADGLRLGVLGGLRPDRFNYGFTGREPVGSAYGSFEAGAPRSLYYSGTLGVMHTLYLGKADELAAIYSQRADLTSKLNMLGSAQVNFDDGAAVVRTKPRLTRADLTVNSPVASALSLRAGANHYEPIDTAAERALAGGTTFYLNNGYWRYWTGSGQSLPWNLSLDEDLSFNNSQNSFSPGMWRVGVSRRGLPWMPSANLNVNAYNLYNPMGPDYGLSVSGNFPLFEGKFVLDGTASFLNGPDSSGVNKLRTSDVSVNLAWQIASALSFHGGAARSYQDGIQSSSVNGGLSYRW